MRFTFTEKKIQTSDALREYAEKKIGKLDRFFREESDTSVTFSLERGRHIAEVTLRNNGMFYRVSEATGDMYASIDSAVASIDRQIRKNKTRLKSACARAHSIRRRSRQSSRRKRRRKRTSSRSSARSGSPSSQCRRRRPYFR